MMSRCIGLAFAINPYILQYVPRQITPFTHTSGKFAAKVFLSCMVTFGRNNGLAYDWRNIATKRRRLMVSNS